MPDLDLREPPADHAAFEAATNGLDLGQFGQAVSVSERYGPVGGWGLGGPVFNGSTGASVVETGAGYTERTPSVLAFGSGRLSSRCLSVAFPQAVSRPVGTSTRAMTPSASRRRAELGCGSRVRGTEQG